MKGIKVIYCFFILIAMSCSSPKLRKEAEEETFGVEKTSMPDVLPASAEVLEKELTPEEYLLFCESESAGYIKSRSMGDIKYTAFQKPISYLALKEFNDLKLVSQKNFDAKVKEFGNMAYYTLKISSDQFQEELLKYNLKDESEYAARIEYCSFKMQKHVYLVCDKDTIAPSLFHFERVYGLNAGLTFLLAFENRDAKKIKRLVCDENLFNNGAIALDFSDINNRPHPKLKLL